MFVAKNVLYSSHRIFTLPIVFSIYTPLHFRGELKMAQPTAHVGGDAHASTSDSKVASDHKIETVYQFVSDVNDARVATAREQAQLKVMNDALIKGDARSFGDAISNYRGEPKKLKAFICDLEKR